MIKYGLYGIRASIQVWKDTNRKKPGGYYERNLYIRNRRWFHCVQMHYFKKETYLQIQCENQNLAQRPVSYLILVFLVDLQFLQILKKKKQVKTGNTNLLKQM